MAITASEARKLLFPLIEQVNEDCSAIEITSKKGNAFLVSEAEWNSLQETAFLLRPPKNAARLLAAKQQIDGGTFVERELDPGD